MYLLGVKNTVFVFLRLVTLKRSTGRAFFKYHGKLRLILELVPHRGENTSSHTQKTGSWYILAIHFKTSIKHPVRPFCKACIQFVAITSFMAESVSKLTCS